MQKQKVKPLQRTEKNRHSRDTDPTLEWEKNASGLPDPSDTVKFWTSAYLSPTDKRPAPESVVQMAPLKPQKQKRGSMFHLAERGGVGVRLFVSVCGGQPRARLRSAGRHRQPLSSRQHGASIA
ncbi:unnamed protein product [Arctogadus glacialis]